MPGSEQVLSTSSTFKLTGIPHVNGTDYWVLAHESANNHFIVFRSTATGVDPSPILSSIGASLSPCSQINTYGSQVGPIVMSSDGTKLALLAYGVPGVSGDLLAELFRFDPTTGTVDHLATLPAFSSPEAAGAEFSPNGSKLYIFHRPWGAVASVQLIQFDVSSNDETTIAASASVVWSDTLTNEQTATTFSTHVMALAPDGRIYIQTGSNPYLGAIMYPNEAGPACGFVENGLSMPINAGAGLPNQCKRYHDSVLSVGVPMHQATGSIEILPNPTDGPLVVRSSLQGSLGVFDAMGRAVVDGQPIRQGSNTFDLSHALPGAYMVRVMTSDGSSFVRCVLKQ